MIEIDLIRYSFFSFNFCSFKRVQLIIRNGHDSNVTNSIGFGLIFNV